MFETLTERIGKAFRHISGQNKLTEQNMAAALKEVRTALLSADVHFKVVRQFIERVQEQCLGKEVIQSVKPAEMAIKVINDELTALLGAGSTHLVEKKQLRILMVGLHGSGKTTTSAKLAHFFQKQERRPLLVACDVYRPGAIDQLQILAEQQSCAFFADRKSKDVPAIAKNGLAYAKKNEAQVVIFDTAGRLQIDEPLVEELKRVKQAVVPDEVLLVADSALGQEAVNVAQTFHNALGLTGIVLTKLDGDARGGAALSMKAITDLPIKFVGTGEKVEDFDRFHPDRMAQRILGMGDVVSLVEIAQEKLDEAKAEAIGEKMLKGTFTLQDMLDQMQQMKKLGSMNKIVKMVPGLNNLSIGEKEEKMMKHKEAMLLSMTKKERAMPYIINASRRRRIAEGAGASVKDLNILLKQYNQMRGLLSRKKGRKLMKQFGKDLENRLPQENS